jgi:ribulose-bisphosphate carboxylase large chain
MGTIKPCLPVPGGSDSAATLEPLYRKLGMVDFGFVPGRGVFGHPLGPRGGAASIRQAWDAISAGVPVAEEAKGKAELAAALEAFGPQPQPA